MCILAALLIATPNYRDIAYIIKAVSRNVEFGLIAMSLTFIIIAGQIDLSIASIMALSSTVAALIFRNLGIPMEICVAIGLLTGLLLGAFNGFLVAYVGIAPMIATIGTLALYRGLAQIAIGDNSIGDFPKWFIGVDRAYQFTIAHIRIPMTIIGLLVVTLLAYVILSFTTTGRKVFAIGTNERAMLYTGIDTRLFKFLLYAVNGLFCGVAGLLMSSRLLVVRYDMALGGELDIIAIVMLGGTSIMGGKGGVIGTFLGLLIVIFLRSGLSVAGVKVDQQLFALGVILLLAIAGPQMASILKERRLDSIARRHFQESPRGRAGSSEERG
jgi:rhamnose transport system permease protein